MKGKIEVSSPVETKPSRWRRLWVVVPVVAIAALGWGAATRGPGMVEQAQAGTDFGARVACSCHFVEGRAIDDCRADFEPGMSMVQLTVEEEARTVTASVPLLASTRATFRKGWGCLLEPWDD